MDWLRYSSGNWEGATGGQLWGPTRRGPAARWSGRRANRSRLQVAAVRAGGDPRTPSGVIPALEARYLKVPPAPEARYLKVSPPRSSATNRSRAGIFTCGSVI